MPKRCTKCQQEKSTSEFNKDSQKKDGLRSYCRECQQIYSRLYLDKNPDKNKQYYKKNREALIQYQHNNRDRFAEKRRQWRKSQLSKNAERGHLRRLSEKNQIGYLPDNYYALVLDFYGECGICRSKDNLTLDHIVPISWGGVHGLENMGVLCRSCNAAKGNRNALDYRTKFIIKELAAG